tara:strand:+ start:32824 stop:33708 length:885 start_codon:yes stop_codon:yes gene_type:complete
VIDELFDYINYLDVKKVIDDRSLNKEVWEAFSGWVKSRESETGNLRVLEIGAGIGTMIERLLDSSILGKCHYIALEPEASFKDAAKLRLRDWSESHELSFKILAPEIWLIVGDELNLTIEWLVDSAENITGLFKDNSFDLLLSHAVVDLLPVPIIMPDILKKLQPQGAYFFSLNFSGETKFEPRHQQDDEISRLYHADMDKRFPTLTWQPSLTGLGLSKCLENYGCKSVVDGESNWLLGIDDRQFIENILETIHKALDGLPGLDVWLAQRSEQNAKGQLMLEISNRDCFGLKHS